MKPNGRSKRYLTDEELQDLDLSETDDLRFSHDLLLRGLRVLGLFAATRKENGTWEYKLLSLTSLYCLIIYGAHIFFVYAAATERYNLMNQLSGISFDEKVFLYSLYAFFLYEGLPLALIFESRKIVNYYRLFARFQARYCRAKGTRFDFKSVKRSQNQFLLFVFIVFTFLFGANIINLGAVYKKSSDSALRPIIENLISIALIILDISVLHLLWYCNMLFLSKAAFTLVNDIKDVFKNGDEELISTFEKLWTDWMYLMKYMGEAFTYSLGYYFVLAIHTSTFELFLSIKEEHIVLIIYGVSLCSSMMAFPITVDRLIHQMTINLKSELFNVGKRYSWWRKQRIKQFVKFMRRFNKEVTIGGFVTLNSGLASSVLGSIVTNVVFLLQFRQVTEIDSSGTNTTASQPP